MSCPSGCKQTGASHHIFKFPDITRPVVVLQKITYLLVYACYLFSQLFCRLCQKMMDKNVEIVRLFPRNGGTLNSNSFRRW